MTSSSATLSLSSQYLLGDKFLADAKHGGEENAMFLQPVDISLPGNGGASKRPGDNKSQLYATTCECCLLLFLVTWHPKTSLNCLCQCFCFFIFPSVQPEMVVSINDAVEAVLPVPCPAHRVVRVAFLEPADHVFIFFYFSLFHIYQFLIFIEWSGCFF